MSVKLSGAFKTFTGGLKLSNPSDNQFSVVFDGSGDAITASSSSDFDFGSSNITIEAWIYASSGALGGSGRFICGTNQTNSDGKNAFYVYGDGRIGFGRVGINEIVSTAGTIAAAQWYHVAVVRNGSTTTIYKDGTSVASGTTSVWASGTDPFNIGGTQLAGSGWYWDGYISNLRVVNGTSVYTSNFTAPSSPLSNITNTVLLTCQSSTIIDNSSSGRTLTAVGNASVNELDPFA